MAFSKFRAEVVRAFPYEPALCRQASTVANPAAGLALLVAKRRRDRKLCQQSGVRSTSMASADPPAPPKESGAAAPGVEATDAVDSQVHKDHPFFRYYGLLVHQQNMLQDTIRTGTYRQAIQDNAIDFTDAVVMDVGTGSGILAHFAVQAGARKVYAVEASGMADRARVLLEANGYDSSKIEVIKGTVEEITIPEPVDIIISEPMGFLLVHEQMLQSYIVARQRFMRPGGKMFPSRGTIYCAPFTDSALFAEQEQKLVFWEQQDFYGLDLSSLKEAAANDHFAQPVVGYFDPSILLADTTATHLIDFEKDSPEDLARVRVPFSFTMTKTALCHGLACWFDVDFLGSAATVRLDTGPSAAGTHWYQCRLMLRKPLGVNATQVVTGYMELVAHEKYSYGVTLSMTLDGTTFTSEQKMNLQDQMYHYLQTGDTAYSYDNVAQ